jgi:hypothetical protein
MVSHDDALLEKHTEKKRDERGTSNVNACRFAEQRETVTPPHAPMYGVRSRRIVVALSQGSIGQNAHTPAAPRKFARMVSNKLLYSAQ